MIVLSLLNKYFLYTNNLNIPLKACFSNKKYILQSKHTRHKLLSIFLNEKTASSGFKKIIGLQN